jgi:hypothetical protein
MAKLELDKAFTQIYHENLWGDPNSRSGIGSSFEQTIVIRRKIPEIISKYNIKSIIDAPCGDLFWIKALLPQFQKEGIKYTGLDIVPEIIEKNKLDFSEPTFNFGNVDLTKGPIPRADLIITRDCFLHLSFENIVKILIRYKESGSKYLLVSLYTKATRKNYDVHDFPVEARPINLLKYPFNFSPPLEIIVEECTEGYGEMSDKSLGLWDLTQIDISEISKNIQKISRFQNARIAIIEKVKRRSNIIKLISKNRLKDWRAHRQRNIRNSLKKGIVFLGIPFTYLSTAWMKALIRWGMNKNNQEFFSSTTSLPSFDPTFIKFTNSVKLVSDSLVENEEISGQYKNLVKHQFSDANVLILCCQGRSGSTLLLRLINSIPGYHLVGESQGALLNLARFYGNIKYTEWVKKLEKTEHVLIAMENSFCYAKVVDQVYNLYYEMFGNSESRMVGFKEIRFGLGSYQEFEHEMNLFKELFPKLKIVFLTREIESLLKSGWWNNDVENGRITLMNQESNFNRYHKQTSSNKNKSSYFLTYKDICDKSPALMGLFPFLGEEFSEQDFLREIRKMT